VNPLFTGQVVANEVILSRAAEKGKTALLLEGNKDNRVYGKVVDREVCRIFACGNRANAESALSILQSNHQPGVLAIVDADTDHLLHRPVTLPNLIVTPTRDLETTLLKAPILANVLIELDLEPDTFGPNPELTAVTATAPLSLIRVIIDQKRWIVRTADFSFTAFVDPKTLACDHAALCRHIANLTVTAGITDQHYQQDLTVLLGLDFDPFCVARGHDISELLAWAISKRNKKKRASGVVITGDLIESFLRVVYPETAFPSSELFSKIREWEENNRPYKALRTA
jgi:hypothetical protein